MNVGSGVVTSDLAVCVLRGPELRNDSSVYHSIVYLGGLGRTDFIQITHCITAYASSGKINEMF